MSSFRRTLVLVFTTAVILALLWWSFSKVEMRDLLEAFRTARWGFLPLAFTMGMFVFLIKALRWRLLIEPLREVKYKSLLSAIMIGFMVNCIFSRLGELVRAGVLGVKGEAKTSTALATIALERIFDMCTVVLFLMLSLLMLQPDASGASAAHLAKIRTAGALTAIAFVGAVIFLVMLKLYPRPTGRLLLMCFEWLPDRPRKHVDNFLKSFLKGLDAIQNLKQVVIVLVLSVAHWIFQVLYFLFIGYCFADLGLTFQGAMLVFAITALGVAALPLPGYIGVFQGGVMIAAGIMALPNASSWSYAWLAWAANIPPIILIGFGFLWADGLSLGQLRAGTKGNR